MPKYLFACPLVRDSGPLHAWKPAIVNLLNTQSPDPYTVRWVTTSGTRAAPWAVGAINLTAAQVALVATDTSIHMIDEAGMLATFTSLSAQKRTRINQFCDTIGQPRPLSNEVLRDLVGRLVTVLNTIESVEGLLGAV